jgi:uncharacterized protein (TIGR02246 family)
MKSTDELVHELADRDAIRDLVARYCDYLWRKDIDGLVNLFTDDGAFIVEGLEVEAVSRGRDELSKMYNRVVDEVVPRVFVHSQVIDLLGAGRANGRCYVEARSAKLDMQWLGSGYYEDEYAKADDQWKFASRRYYFDGIDTAIPLRAYAGELAGRQVR